MPTSTQGAPECTPAMRVAQLAHGYMVSSALGAAVRLNVAETLGDSEMKLSDLAAKLEVDAESLHRVLRLLSSFDIFAQVRDKVYANTDASNSLRCESADSQRGFIEFITDPFHFQQYTDMVPTIKSGRPAPEINTGKNIFDVLASDVDEQRRFDNAMTDLTKSAVHAVLEAYDFKGISMLVDVAGGHGLLLTAILAKHPTMHGMIFDLPHVASGAKTQINKLNLQDRCGTVGGDFFKALPQSEAFIMKHIIHDWDDERALVILKNCRTAMTESGARKLLLVEMLLPEGNQPHPAFFLDVEMMMLPGGKERTQEEYETLLDQAGFRLNRVVPTHSPYSVLEAVPSNLG